MLINIFFSVANLCINFHSVYSIYASIYIYRATGYFVYNSSESREKNAVTAKLRECPKHFAFAKM